MWVCPPSVPSVVASSACATLSLPNACSTPFRSPGHSNCCHSMQEPLALPSEAGEAGDDTTTRDSAGGAVAGAAGAGGAATSRERTPGAAVGGAAAAAEAVAAAEEDDMMKDMAALTGKARGTCAKLVVQQCMTPASSCLQQR